MTASILVVDDIIENVKLYTEILTCEYYTVLTANSGSVALEMLAHNRIDLVLLDVMMPGMDGFEVCQKIKANPNTAHIPVIIITALADQQSRIKGLEVGADEFLTKPINKIPLLPRVKSLTRMKLLIDELKLRNKTNQELGLSPFELNDQFQSSRILFINDDIVQANNIKKTISKITNNIQVIRDPNDMSSFDNYSPDLVIISCQLESPKKIDDVEKVDPLRVASNLMSKENYKYSVFMLMAEEEDLESNGDDAKSIVIKGIELGINDYFLSSVDRNELVARIKTQLRRKKYQDNLRNSLEQSVNLSIKDSLTNVFNRRYFDIHIKQMIQHAKEKQSHLSLIILDIDHFKAVNDKYGHEEGDIILKTFTNVIQESVRVTDLIARYGGEEFVILLGDTAIEEAEEVAKRIKININQTKFKILNNTKTISKTASMGIAEYIQDESAESLLKRADTVLYKAKRAGRDRIFIYAEVKIKHSKMKIHKY